MKVLIVGGAGYVGGAVTDLLSNTRHDIRVYDALFYEESFRKPVPFVFGDVRDREKLKPQLDWAEIVIWLAALVGDPACALNPDLSAEINQESVKWLSQNFKGRLIFLSTCSVYGARDGVSDELSPTNPLSVYASTKLEAEKYLPNALIFRLGTLFGIGDLYSRIRLDLVVNTLVVKAYQTGRLQVYGGNQYRPLLHVKDAARAIVNNITTDFTGIYNLHKQNIKIVDLATNIKAHFPSVIIENIDRKFEDTRNYKVSSEKAHNILNFNPTYSITRGIAEIKEILEQGRLKDIDNPRYVNQKFLSYLGGVK
jgi:nucleoside-diphosphate-sugar epimerase